VTLVAGVDSSTQSCKVLVCDAETGRVVRQGSAPHPTGTEVDPENWWRALLSAVDSAGGLADVEALAVAGQQHGLVALDERGEVLRPALLWNDTRSARAAEDLVRDLAGQTGSDGAAAWAGRVGSVPVAALTVAKLRWLADHEPALAARLAAVALPHDWLTWRLAGDGDVRTLTTDRSDASGTGYYDPVRDAYDREILDLALRRPSAAVALPRVVPPGKPAARGAGAFGHLALGPGCGDNAGAALGLGMTAGDVTVSVGTSGVVSVVSDAPARDASGLVSGFADATGRYLPLVCTLNAARVLDATAALLGVDLERLSSMALSARPGAGGCVFVPYLEGERTPNLPDATGSLHGLSLTSMTPENLSRAAVEGVVCSLAHGLDLIVDQGASVERVNLIGGAARSEALRQVASAVLGHPVVVPEPGEYVALGAARQAAWTLVGGEDPPAWPLGGSVTVETEPTPSVREAYAETVAALGHEA
jgi:xylulokinase